MVDKSLTPSLKPEESTDFTHYFADFVKKHLTPPMPLGLGHATAPPISNTLPHSLPPPFFACVEGRVYLCAGFLVDGALGINTCEEEEKTELKKNWTAVQVQQKPQLPLRSSGAERALPHGPLETEIIWIKAASFSRGWFLGEDLSRESLKGNAASRGMSVLILKEVPGWYTTTSTPLWLTLVIFPVST